jgi:hypothetical protein
VRDLYRLMPRRNPKALPPRSARSRKRVRSLTLLGNCPAN